MASAFPFPDLILLEVRIPDMDGFEVCRRLKNYPGTANIPVIFISALPDEENEVHSFSVGGVEYLSKSILPVLIKSRLKTHLALRNAYQNLVQLQSERKLMEDILLCMLEQPLAHEDFVRTLLVPVKRTNGDIFLMARRPDGSIHAIVGDSTGHGLCAAMTAPMVIDIFYVMTKKGLLPAEILCEINRKLSRTPPNIFTAGCFVELSQSLDVIRLWNHGMPEVLFLRGEKWFLECSSRYLPLGINSGMSISGFHRSIPLQPGDRIYLYSDGVVETKSPKGEEFGLERLKASLGKIVKEGRELSSLLTVLNAFRMSEVSEDDITVIEFNIPSSL